MQERPTSTSCTVRAHGYTEVREGGRLFQGALLVVVKVGLDPGSLIPEPGFSPLPPEEPWKD